jgi:uncharacterized membrane-anchored protein YhcB (DUF1043 family)
MDKKKANSNVKTTMDFFKQKRAKENKGKQISKLESDISAKASVTTKSDFCATNQTIFKQDITELDSYLKNMKDLLTNFSETRKNQSLYDKDFDKRINTIKENIEKDTKESMATNRMNSLNINYLLKEYKCNDKETLLSDIAFENLTLKLILEKLDDLFFLINLRLLDFESKFSKNYKKSLSQIMNIKYLCKEISSNENLKLESNNAKYQQTFNMEEMEGLDKGLLPLSHANTKNMKESMGKTITETQKTTSNMGTTKRSMDGPSINYELKEIPVDIVSDISTKINEMKKFGDFLNFDYDQDDFFRDIFEKIRELFYVYNKNVFDPIVDLINTKFQVKSDLSNKVKIVLKNEVNDCYENVMLMRKILEDNHEENKSKINELNNDKKILDNKYKELEVKFNKQKKLLDEIGNRDYSNYYKEMKESNNAYLKEFEKLEKKRNEKLHEQYENELAKNKDLKKEVKECRSEIFALKTKLDNLSYIKDKSGDDYVKALQEQFEDAAQSFQDEISSTIDEYNQKNGELQRKCNELENENKHLKGIQVAIIKKFDKMESLFGK